MRFVPNSVLIRLCSLSEDEEKIMKLLRQGSNLLGQIKAREGIDELDWRAYEDSEARARTVLDSYSGRFSPYFRDLFSVNQRKANES